MNEKIGKYRWVIVALLFFATAINYVDRQVLGILAPQLQKELSWSESDYGLIISCFQVAYAIGLLISGRVLDRIGIKPGYSIAVTIWSLAAMFHAFTRGIFAFASARFLLGIGESANFPAAVKTVAEWFPKKERALAVGIFNSGSNVGAILAPIIVPWIALQYSWQWAFLLTGALGLVWLVFWLAIYQKPEVHGRLNAQELKYIQQDGVELPVKIPWQKIFLHKQTFGIALSLFITAPIWWFFLYWLPKFLNTNLHVELQDLALPLILIYVVSDIGSIIGGWHSSWLVKKGADPIQARKRTIFLLALLVLPIYFASLTQSLWIAVVLIALATFAHQGYSANIFTLISDVYPKAAVGSVVGLALFSGAVGGVLYSYGVGLILEHTHSYAIVFGMASLAYVLSWAVLKIFVPNNKKIDLIN